MTYPTPVRELVARVACNAGDLDICVLLSETDPVKPFLSTMAEELIEAGHDVSDAVWHCLILAAAAGYQVGLADAFAGMEAVTNVVPVFRNSDGPEAA